MNDDTGIRISIFLLVLAIMLLIEIILPFKRASLSKIKRWTTNLAIIVVGSLVARLLGPISAVGAAYYANAQSWGLFNQLDMHPVIECVLVLVILDFSIYWQHVFTHKIPILWRFHKVHHCDRDVDASTALRFHPVEIAFSVVFKTLLVLVLGPMALAVIIFEILLNASAIFNHANIRLPKTIEPMIRSVIVTPSMHRTHHSVLPHETDSNFGFCLSCWDRLFGSYTAKPSVGENKLCLGLYEYQNHNTASFIWSLSLPFKKSLPPSTEQKATEHIQKP